jgi:glycosyltransferase involved in cell wall biosynthesis
MTSFENINPLVSVCILTYNQENTISETIESVLKQVCYFKYEIIIGEDCSTDNTLKICKKYQSLYPETIKIIVSKQNMGIMSNFKQVTEIIRGKYFAGCGGDDYWHDQNKLQLQIQLMENNLNYGMVHSGCRLLYAFNNEFKDFHLKNLRSNNVFESILTGTYGQIFASTTCLRTSLFRKYVFIEDYIESGYLMEDFPMWLDLSINSDIGYIARPLVTYRISDESISQSKSKEKMLIFLKSRWKVQFDYALKYKVSNSVYKRIKRDKNAICINIAFNSNNIRESMFWIKNVEFKNLIIYPSYRHFLLIILIFLNVKQSNIKWIKMFFEHTILKLRKSKFNLNNYNITRIVKLNKFINTLLIL